MMDIYFASPGNQQQAEHCTGQNVLLSFPLFGDWLYQYAPAFDKLMIDSGAFSEMNSGKKIDLGAYREWTQQWRGIAEAIAGLDDIRGDWKKSLKNFKAIEWTFPVWHDSDPIELIDELSAMAIERKTWIAIGLVPPREGKEHIVRAALDRIPDGLHVHGFALRRYANLRRFDSFDSTNWWRDAMLIRKKLDFLHFGECLDLIVKRYQRENRRIYKGKITENGDLFECLP